MKRIVALLMGALIFSVCQIEVLAAVPENYFLTALSQTNNGALNIEKTEDETEFNSRLTELVNKYDGEYFSEIVIDVAENTIKKDSQEPVRLEEYGIDYSMVESEKIVVAAVPVLELSGIDADFDEKNGTVTVNSETGEQVYEFADESKFAEDEIISSDVLGGVEINATDDETEIRNVGYFNAEQGEENFALNCEYKDGVIVVTSPFQTKRLIVEMKSGKELKNSFGAIESVTDSNGYYVLQYESEVQTKNAYQILTSDRNVDSVECDVVVSADEITNRTAAETIQSDRYREYLKANGKNEEIVVAVLDTGVDTKHRFLSDRMLVGYDVYEDSTAVVDKNGHGTHVAGIIVDNTNDNVKILPIKVLQDNGYGSGLAVKLGIEKAVALGADVINMSLSGKCESGECSVEVAVKFAVSNNVTVVVAAGNDRADCGKYCPAKIKECITVASSSEDGLCSTSFSNYGSSVDLTAPGENVLSCKPGGGYVAKSGTSMAAPFVAASAALLLTDNKELTFSEVEQTLKKYSADLLIKGWDKYSGAGVLDFGLFFNDSVSANFISSSSSSRSVQAFSKAALHPLRIKVTNTTTNKKPTDRSFTVTTTNSRVAYFDGKYIIPVGAGTATLTFKRGSKSATCSVTVTKVDCWVDYAAEEFAGGDGSSENPYLISNANELAKLLIETYEGNDFKDKYLKLTNDIDLAGKYWNSLPLFCGTLDGDNHKILNLKIFDVDLNPAYATSDGIINSEWYSNYAFFDSLRGATIKNIGFENATCNNSTGAIVSRVVYEKTIVENCYVSGFSAGNAFFVQVLNYGVKIKNCYSSATTLKSGFAKRIHSSQNYGGTVFSNCFVCGDIVSSEAAADDGGFACIVESQLGYRNTKLINCFVSGVTANGIGFAYEQTDSVFSKCYYNENSKVAVMESEFDEHSEFIAADDEFFKNKENYLDADKWDKNYLWDFENVWEIDPDINNGYPYLKNMVPDESAVEKTGTWLDYAAASYAGGNGTKQSPYLIENSQQLARISKMFRYGGGEDVYFRLISDIDLSGHDWFPIGGGYDINSLGEDSKIDAGKKYFYGNIDGDGHKITNMTINSTGDYIGFMSKSEINVIKNLVFENAKVSGNRYVGIVCGVSNYYCDIVCCYVSGTISSSREERGGITGFLNSGSKVISCGILPDSSVKVVVGTSYGIIENCTVSDSKVRLAINNYGILRNNFSIGDKFVSSSLEKYGKVMNSVIYSSDGKCQIFTDNDKKVIDKTSDIKKEDFSGFDFENLWLETDVTFDEENDRTVFVPVLRETEYTETELPSESWKDVAKTDFQGEGTVESPYLIATAEQLAGFVLNLSKYKECHFRLVNDIDLAGRLWCAKYSSGYATYEVYLDGNNKTIYNLTVENGAGLISSGVSGVIENLHLKNIIGNSACGIVNTNKGIIRNCSVEGNISFATIRNDKGGNNNSPAGGIALNNYSDGSIENCWFIGEVCGVNNVAGIVGYNTGKIRNCYVDALIMGSKTGIGNFAGNNNSNTSVEKCYSKKSPVKTSGKDTCTDCYFSDSDLKDKSTFVGWDFDTVWDIDETKNGGYPFLRQPTSKTITYVLNGGEDPGYLQKDYIVGTTVTLQSAKREEFAFDGWYEDADFKNRIDVIDSSFSEDVKLYAKWSDNVYEINFDLNGAQGNIDRVFLGLQENFKIPDCEISRTYYTFMGWSTTENGEVEYKAGDVVSGLADKDGTVTLYAQWQRDSYEIQFYGNGADKGSLSSIEAYIGEYVALPISPYVKEGYVFRGWSTSSDGDVEFEDGASVKNIGLKGKSVKLYAVWDRFCVIKFVSSGGSGTMKEITVFSRENGKLPKNQFEKPGHSFAGWAIEKDGSAFYEDEELTAKVIGNRSELVLYAVWKPNEYPAIFDANGGLFPDGEASKTVETTYGLLPTLPDEPILNGKVFKQWSPEVSPITEKGANYYAVWANDVECNYDVLVYIMDLNGKYSLESRSTFTARNCQQVTVTPQIREGFVVDESKSVLSGKVSDDDILTLAVYYIRNCHNLKFVNKKPASCLKNGNIEHYHCSICGRNYKESTAATELKDKDIVLLSTGHSYKTTTVVKATLSKNGVINKKCSTCSATSQTPIYYPKTITLSATNYIYDGKVKTPAVTVKDSSGKVLKNNTDYTVAYSSGRKAMGKYTVTVTFKGNYTGSKQLNFTISTKAPAKVTATQTTDQIKLSWDKVSGATGYRIFYKSGSSWKVLVSSTTATSYTVSKLKAGTKYTFAVRPYVKVGSNVIWSPYTECATATKTVKPSKVTAKQTASTITLSWPQVSGATGYRIYYKSGSTWKTLVSSTTATSYTVKNLKAGAKYTFAVRPYTNNGSTVVWSDYTTYTAATTPATVTAKVSSPSKGKINLSWNAVSGSEGYQVYYKTGNGSYKLYKTVSASTKSLSFSNLKSGTKYTFAIRAVVKTSGGNIYSGYNAATVMVK